MSAPARPSGPTPFWLGVGALVILGSIGLVLWMGSGSGDRGRDLLLAILADRASDALSLVEAGADLDTRVPAGEHTGKTALMLAAQRNEAALVHAMLDRGADPDASNGRGGTALMYAATDGHAEVVAELLGAGARPNLQAENGWTALMLATVKGHHGIIRALVDAGADVDIADVYRWTPLMRAAEKGDVDTVELLLALGANAGARNDQGVDAAGIAEASGHPELARRLADHGDAQE